MVARVDVLGCARAQYGLEGVGYILEPFALADRVVDQHDAALLADHFQDVVPHDDPGTFVDPNAQ